MYLLIDDIAYELKSYYIESCDNYGANNYCYILFSINSTNILFNELIKYKKKLIQRLYIENLDINLIDLYNAGIEDKIEKFDRYNINISINDIPWDLEIECCLYYYDIYNNESNKYHKSLHKVLNYLKDNADYNVNRSTIYTKIYENINDIKNQSILVLYDKNINNSIQFSEGDTSIFRDDYYYIDDIYKIKTKKLMNSKNRYIGFIMYNIEDKNNYNFRLYQHITNDGNTYFCCNSPIIEIINGKINNNKYKKYMIEPIINEYWVDTLKELLTL